MNGALTDSHTDIDHLISEAEQFVQRRIPDALRSAKKLWKARAAKLILLTIHPEVLFSIFAFLRQ